VEGTVRESGFFVTSAMHRKSYDSMKRMPKTIYASMIKPKNTLPVKTWIC